MDQEMISQDARSAGALPGAGRPDFLTGSGTPGVEPVDGPKGPARRKQAVCFAAAIASFFIGYFYIAWNKGLFGILFLCVVEAFARALRIPRGEESDFWALMLGAQSLAGILWNFQDPVLGWLQMILLHLTAVYYVLCRGNVLIRGETSPYAPFDFLAGLIVIPLTHLPERAKALLHFRAGKGKVGQWIVGIILAVVLSAIALAELSGASDFFYENTTRLSEKLSEMFSSIEMQDIVLSYPVGIFLFALVAGAFSAKKSPLESVAGKTDSWRKIVPQVFTASMVLLILIYAVFFVTSSRDFLISVTGSDFSAVDASSFAVKGFWNLVRIVLLNEALIALQAVFGTGREQKSLRAATFAIMAMSLAFAALDAVKLGLYIGMFGWTLRRFYAVWALAYLIMTVILTAVRERRTFPLIKILGQSGIFVFTGLILLGIYEWPVWY